MRTSRITRIALQLAVSAAFLGVLIWRADMAGIARSVRAADWRWIALALPLMAASTVMHGVRWWLLVRRAGRVPLGGTVLVLLAATSVSVILPLRAGVGLQLQVLHRRYGVDRSAVAGTLVVEGLLDAVVLLAFALVAVPLLGLGRAVLLGALAAAGGAAAMIAFAGLLARGRSRAWWLARLPERLRDAAGRMAVGLVRGFAALGRPGTVALLLAVTLADWTLATGAYWLVGHALGLDVPPFAYLAVEIVGNLSGAVPLTQSNVGPYELAVAEVMAAFGATGDAAGALAVVAHAMVIAVEALTGLAAFWWLRLGRRDLFYLQSSPPSASSAP